jgi:hypothetical protein
MLAAIQFPPMNTSRADTCKALIIGRESDTSNIRFTASQRPTLLSSGRIPNAHVALVRAGGHTLAVRGPSRPHDLPPIVEADRTKATPSPSRKRIAIEVARPGKLSLSDSTSLVATTCTAAASDKGPRHECSQTRKQRDKTRHRRTSNAPRLCQAPQTNPREEQRCR